MNEDVLEELVKVSNNEAYSEDGELENLTDMLAIIRELVDVELLSDDPYIQESLSNEMIASPESVIIILARYIMILKEKENRK